MFNLKKLIRAAIVLGVYVGLSLALSTLSFQVIQVRVAEMMTILPFFFPETIISLTLGCLLVNLSSPFGWVDILGGTACTLCAGLLTYACRRIPSKQAVYIALLPPILINALGVGLYLTILTSPTHQFSWPSYGLIALSIFIGQTIAVGIGGTLLIQFIGKGKWMA